MLELSDTRWVEFDSFFGEPAELPLAIGALARTAGTPGEAEAWAKVRDYFLSQSFTAGDGKPPGLGPPLASQRIAPIAPISADARSSIIGVSLPQYADARQHH